VASTEQVSLISLRLWPLVRLSEKEEEEDIYLAQTMTTIAHNSAFKFNNNIGKL